jgi:NitT/TauT family transport system permease protein/sulfonate transport system permease protein
MKKILAILTFVLSWHLLSILIASPVLPSPIGVVIALFDGIQDGTLPVAIMASLGRVAVGFILAVVAGVTLGLGLGLYFNWGDPIKSLLELMRPIPPIAWVPLAILWFGIGDQSAWFIVFVGAFFPIFIQVYVAFVRPPRDLMELAQQYEFSPSTLFWHVRLPAAAPEIFQALRVGLGLAWTSVIAAELVGVRAGLGDRIGLLRYSLDYEGVIACMICIGCLGWLMSIVAFKMERWLCPWVNYTSRT